MKLYAILPFILQALAWPVAHTALRISGTFTVHGKEHLKNITGPYIIAANHVNDIDPVITRAIHPFLSKPLFWVARFRKDYDTHAEESFKGWRGLLYQDWFFRSWGAYPAYQGTGDYEKALRHHIRLLKDGYSVVIFPQGGKAKYLGKDAPVRGGAAFLAAKTGVPIVPVGIDGTLHLNARGLFLGRRRFVVHIGKPKRISPQEENAPPEFYKKQMIEIMNDIYKIIESGSESRKESC